MRKLRRECIVAVNAVLLVNAIVLPAAGGGYRVVFEDRFLGSALDRVKWATRYVHADGTLATLNNEAERYSDNGNHVVKGGVLSLVARSNKDGSGHYESGMIRSRQTFYYGYFEARVYLPTAQGVWPAFWLNSDYNADGRLQWPPEIDVFEYVINGKEDTADMIHSGVAISKNGAQGGSWLMRDELFNQPWKYYRAASPLNQGWHVVGLLWKPDSVAMYLDGKKLYTRHYRWVYESGELAGPAHILLNLAVGGAWAGRHGVDESAFPQSFRIDYVRVCQYLKQDAVSDSCGGSKFAPSLEEAAYDEPSGSLETTRLLSADWSGTKVAPGGKLEVRYVFDAKPTESVHQVHSVLVDDRGKTVASASDFPEVPTTSWKGKHKVKQTLLIPGKLNAGTYILMVWVGSEVSPSELRRIPITAEAKFGIPDGKLRYRITSIRVCPAIQSGVSPQCK